MEYFLLISQTLIIVGLAYLIFNSKKRQPKSGQRLFVDTSVLIDGRIISIAKAGFIGQTLAITRSVIGELQLLADGSNGDKRSKARHGLDVIRELQAIDHITVEIFADNPQAPEGVDRRLVKLAREYDGALCTVDYNLNKVAQVEGITVANVNELAKSIRMEYLPGSKLSIALTTKGNEASQAVGHLEDGTMVVVEQAKAKIGSTVEIEVIRSLQTDAGRMLFARLTQGSSSRSNKSALPKSLGRAKKKHLTSNSDNSSAGRPAKSQESTKKSASKSQSNSSSGRRSVSRTEQHSRRKNSKQKPEERLIALVDEQSK